MRKIVVVTFVSLDGVMQAPGEPQEDTSDGFTLGGWTFPYFDEALGKVMGEQMTPPFDLLLGKTTYDIFAAHWPLQGSDDPAASLLNNAQKYVVAEENFDPVWQNSVVITGNVVDELKKLKSQDGPVLQVHGSSQLLQTLLKDDLVD